MISAAFQDKDMLLIPWRIFSITHRLANLLTLLIIIFKPKI